MKTWFVCSVVLMLVACGVETAGTAATAASVKKQELEQGQKTMEQFQQKLDQANLQTPQRTEQAGAEK